MTRSAMRSDGVEDSRIRTTVGLEIPGDWHILPFEVYVLSDAVERKPSVPQSSYKTTGRFPVVDQGAKLIAGYTDDEDLVHQETLPLILFGDHTRIFKFLDFPFAAGADGTKLLRANDQVVDPRFLYYAFLHLEIPSRGYNRHFKYLQEKEILSPASFGEQRAIAVLLSKIQEAVEMQEKLVAKLKELKAATMAKLFREGLRGEPLKQTEIGEIPESWDVPRLGDHCDVKSGGTPSRNAPQYWNGNIAWVKTGEIDYRPITSTEEYITEAGLQNSSAKLFPKGTLLMAMYGQGVTRGKVAFLKIEAATNQACAALLPNERLDPGYLYAFCTFAYDRIRELGHGANQKNLSADIIREILLPLPASLAEQREIYRALNVIESRLLFTEQKCDALKSLFSSMLHRLMTGQVRLSPEMIALQSSSARKEKRKRDGRAPDQKVLDEVVRRIVEVAAPEKIILFGSAARGEMGPNSDIDLLVIKPGQFHRGKVTEQIYMNLFGVGQAVDVVVVTPEDVERYRNSHATVIAPAMHDGRVVYAA